ncbi:hypothetical protein VTN49DRAFT_5720 [Thermomyces lanuginosus]|uniref:uncharacterized protein n=1 Tax=Thermomyces lanuginosus TaxID=5541 RepID=UPI0037423260
MSDSDRRIPIHALLNPKNTEPECGTSQPSSQRQYGHERSGLYHDKTNYDHGLGRSDSEETTLDFHTPTNSDNQLQHYQRDGSVSSASSRGTVRRRAPRPKYEEEEMYFIWYHRVDLEEEWKEVQRCFNRQFYHRGRAERNTQGIQCKFYRFIKEKKCPTVREQRRLRDGEFMGGGRRSRNDRLPAYGVVKWCGIWFPWMRPEHAPEARRATLIEEQQGTNSEHYASSSLSGVSEVSTPSSEPYSPSSDSGMGQTER